MKIKILGISGSLRLTSSNNLLIRQAAKLMPPEVEFIICEQVGKLPHFDDSPVIPQAVIDFHQQLKEADGVFICTPEYAFGVPGSLKNALDWTVGTGDLVDKPVALVTASSSGAKAHAALLETLKAISADIFEGGTTLIPFIRSKINENGEFRDADALSVFQSVIDALVNRIKVRRDSINLQEHS